MRNVKPGIASAVCAVCLLAAVAAGAGCAPKAHEGPLAKDASITVDFTWSADANCATCHATEDGSLEGMPCYGALSAAGGNTCSVCHADEAGLEKAHEGATPDRAKERATRLRDTAIDEQACFACHGSYEELAAKTADSAVLTDAKGTVVNPHARPAGEGHAGQTCADCHALHSGEPVQETAPEFCISCHHTNDDQCHTCHQ